ncbi:MAG: glycosyltransferase [Methanophagales archaeon]|nr:glycosyltransferase [Methanophagales archaeon]
MKKEFSVSIIVCTYYRRKLFNECFESLLNQSYPKDNYEIIVVDSSDDFSEELIKNYKEKAERHRIMLKYFYQEPKGLAAARNLGIKNARGEIICFIDDDCVADRFWVEKLVEGFDNERVGGVGGKILIYNQEGLINYLPGIDQYSLINDWSCIAGANMAYRRDVLEQIGGFDPLFKFGGDDNDVAIRVKLRGYTLKYNEGAVIYFRHRSNLRELIRQQYGYGIGFSRLGKKYPNLQMKKAIFLLLIKLIWNIATFPRCLLMKKDKKQMLLRRVINIIVVLSYLTGVISGYVSVRYPEEKIILCDFKFFKPLADDFLKEKIKNKFRLR